MNNPYIRRIWDKKKKQTPLNLWISVCVCDVCGFCWGFAGFVLGNWDLWKRFPVPWRIHGIHVVKYTNPMDPSWVSFFLDHLGTEKIPYPFGWSFQSLTIQILSHWTARFLTVAQVLSCPCRWIENFCWTREKTRIKINKLPLNFCCVRGCFLILWKMTQIDDLHEILACFLLPTKLHQEFTSFPKKTNGRSLIIKWTPTWIIIQVTGRKTPLFGDHTQPRQVYLPVLLIYCLRLLSL